jgi:transposase InsO family protein
MYFKINPVFVGRDRFEAICREYGFMVGLRKSSRRTTDSSGVVRFDNLLKDKQLTGINQAWSSDITYFEIDNTFYYITFILDCYSRRILGHQVSARLFTDQTSLPALKKAIKVRGVNLPEGIIFHSDGGGQYYDQDFLDLTKRFGFKNSMCEYAFENGKAERLNGVIKNNYLKHWEINDVGDLTKAVDRAVHLYNTDKPHSSLHRNTPISFEAKFSKLALSNPTTASPLVGQQVEKRSTIFRH